jgi:putative DNA primase/helicase
MTENAPLVLKAAMFVDAGFAVFPVHTINEGRCSCRKSCGSPGKHPIASLAPHGCLDALCDPRAVMEWWGGWPDANIGLATGDVSNLLVVDIDPANGGDDAIANLEARFGELEPTWSVATGSGGTHLYYRMPNADIRNSASAVGPGIDIRANGGYVVAPPSRHISGGKYRWGKGEWGPNEGILGEVPEWLLKRLAPAKTLQSSSSLPRIVKEGTRNVWMASAAGAMRRKGFGEGAILAALRFENRERCSPPLDDRELERIAHSIERYAPAPTFTAGQRFIASA